MRQPMISSCAVSWCRFVIPWADRVVPRWRARLIVLGVLASCVVGTISRAGDPPAEGPSTTAFTTGDSGAADAINPAPAADANVQASSLYTEHVKPLFAEKCISCHGPVEQEAGLRLDAGSLIHEADKASSLLTPSDPASSELLIRVSDPDEHARMPPPGEGTSLTESERETLRRWIAAGGPFPNKKPTWRPHKITGRFNRCPGERYHKRAAMNRATAGMVAAIRRAAAIRSMRSCKRSGTSAERDRCARRTATLGCDG